MKRYIFTLILLVNGVALADNTGINNGNTTLNQPRFNSPNYGYSPTASYGNNLNPNVSGIGNNAYTYADSPQSSSINGGNSSSNTNGYTPSSSNTYAPTSTTYAPVTYEQKRQAPMAYSPTVLGTVGTTGFSTGLSTPLGGANLGWNFTNKEAKQVLATQASSIRSQADLNGELKNTQRLENVNVLVSLSDKLSRMCSLKEQARVSEAEIFDCYSNLELINAKIEVLLAGIK